MARGLTGRSFLYCQDENKDHYFVGVIHHSFDNGETWKCSRCGKTWPIPDKAGAVVHRGVLTCKR
jgi:hypothetical protein